jgi:hypothetical protein
MSLARKSSNQQLIADAGAVPLIYDAIMVHAADCSNTGARTGSIIGYGNCFCHLSKPGVKLKDGQHHLAPVMSRSNGQ